VLEVRNLARDLREEVVMTASHDIEAGQALVGERRCAHSLSFLPYLLFVPCDVSVVPDHTSHMTIPGCSFATRCANSSKLADGDMLC
jgi:hypothetical protein